MERARQYKHQDKDSSELRRRRQDESIELRKVKKDEKLSKRRNIDVSVDDLDDSFDDKNFVKPGLLPKPTDSSNSSKMNENKSGGVDKKTSNETASAGEPDIRQNVKDLLDLGKAPGNYKFDKVLDVVRTSRRLLSRAKNPPIDEYVDSGTVPVFVLVLKSPSPTELMFEACWSLTNIASGSSKHTESVVKNDGIPALVPLLKSDELTVVEQAVWALGNITGESAHFRDLVIKENIVEPLKAIIGKHSGKSSLMGNVAWLMSNLCRNKSPPPPFAVVASMIPELSKMAGSDDINVRSDATWALNYATENVDGINDVILQSNVAYDLTASLRLHNPVSIIAPSLRTLGNLVTGTDEQTDQVLACGVLKYVKALIMYESKPTIQKEACWMLSNVTAGTDKQIQMVIDCGCIPSIITVMEKGESKSQREALWVISNLVNGGLPAQISYILELNCLAACVPLMRDNQSRYLLLVMELIDKLLQRASEIDKMEYYALEFEAAGGLNEVDTLQENENEQVYHAALSLVEKYFNDEGLANAENEEPEESKENNDFKLKVEDSSAQQQSENQVNMFQF